jgi:hypothetical protein
MRNTYLYGFATFGHPNDYRQSAFKLDNKEIAKNVKIFDLPNAIKVFPNSTLYSIRKENIGGVAGISYSIYTFANEMTSMRDGTFIGSSILFTNEIAVENVTVGKLNEFHNILIANNTENDKLIVNHSDKFNHSNKFLDDFEKVSYHLKPIEDLENFNSSNKHLVVGSRIDQNSLTTNFKKALLLLNKYDTIFFTYSNEIIGYCQSRNIYQITDEKGFEQEITNIQYEKQQKVLNSISEFEKEKQKLQTDKEEVISNLKSQLANSKNAHIENERVIRESESNIDKIISFYAEFSRKLDDYANQLRSHNRLEDVRKLYNENLQEFRNSVATLKQPQYTKKIDKVKANSNLHGNYKPQFNQGYNQSNSDFDRREEKVFKSKRFNNYIIFTAVFGLLWLLTLVYFLWFNKQNKSEIEPQIEQTTIPNQQTITHIESVKLSELNPIPNSKLNGNDLKFVSKEGIKNKTPKQIIEIIFAKNPTDIASHYNNQKEVYEKVLISQNSNCFQNNICICDSLLNIPSNKK